VEIHAYAIVCREDCIADADGHLPPVLMNEADWRYFQHELDRADIVVLGRRSHEATPNFKKRKRLIVSSAAHGLEPREDGWWWNPVQLQWPRLVERLGLEGARIGVPGGQGVFDLFLEIGMSAFHLSRAERVTLPLGRKLFGGMPASQDARGWLIRHGLSPGEAKVIDPEADVSLTIFSKMD
jgi:hypothetical protein